MADAPRSFVDTNVFVYAFDTGEPVKRDRAIEVLAGAPPGSLVTSAQVLGEFYVTVTRKLAFPLDVEQARRQVMRLAPLARVAVDRRLVADAIRLCERESISYWDALIVTAAASAGCAALLTEDLSAGGSIDGVTIENPFATR